MNLHREYAPKSFAVGGLWHGSLRQTSALLIAILALLLLPQSASAHAILVESTPLANSRVALSPSEIRLTFSEPLEPDFARLTLFDSKGNAIPMQPAALEEGNAFALVQPLDSLASDLYTVRWSVVSAADGHGTQGSFSFVVGDASAVPPPGFAVVESVPQIDSAAAIVRMVHLLALAVLAGALAFSAIFGRVSGAQHFTGKVRWIVLGAWLVYGATLLAALAFQFVNMRSASTQAVDSDFIGDLLLSSRFGQLWIARTFVWLVLGVALLLMRRDRVWPTRIGVALAAILMLLQSVQSHAAATPLQAAAITSDFLHLTLSALWLGGLLALLVALFSVPTGMGLRVALITPFSNYARLLLVGLVVTGIYAAWLQVGSLEALISTTYGAALIAKLLFMLPLLAIGAVNWWSVRTTPQRDNGILRERLRPLVAAEIVLLVGVFGAVGVMTTTMPARAGRDLAADAGGCDANRR